MACVRSRAGVRLPDHGVGLGVFRRGGGEVYRDSAVFAWRRTGNPQKLESWLGQVTPVLETAQ